MRGRQVASALVGLGLAAAVTGCAQQPINHVADRTWVAASASTSPSPSATPSASPATSAATSAAAGGPAATTAPPKTQPVAQSLAFTARTLDGKTFKGSSLAGKPAVLWFWTPWCPLCRGQAPDVRDATSRFAGKINIVGIGGLDSAAPMRTFVAEQKTAAFPNLCDQSGAVWKHFQVTSQSTYVLIDATGKVRYRGYLDGASLRSRVAKLSA